MTTIRTTCDNCGNVELTIGDIKLDREQYRFNCSGCGTIQSHPATRKVQRMLLAVGVEHVETDQITEAEIKAFVTQLDLRGMDL